jgi:hypothetical protein
LSAQGKLIESQFTFTFREWLAIRRILGLRMWKHRTPLGVYSVNKTTYQNIEDAARKLHHSRVNPKVPAATWRSLSLLLGKVTPAMHGRADFNSLLETARHHSCKAPGKPKDTPLIRAIVTLAAHFHEATGKRVTCYWNNAHETYEGPFIALAVACLCRAGDIKPRRLGRVVREVLSILRYNKVQGV